MGYFELQEDLFSGHSITGYPQLPDDVSFLSGLPASWQPDAPLRFGLDGPPEDFPGHFFAGSIPVVSKALLDAIRSSGIDNFQAFDAILVGPSGTEWDGYFAFNAIGIIDSVDDELSGPGDMIMPDGEKEGGPPGLYSFAHPVISSRKARGLLMFREVRMPPLLVFDDALDRFLLAYRPPEGWSIRIRRMDEKFEDSE